MSLSWRKTLEIAWTPPFFDPDYGIQRRFTGVVAVSGVYVAMLEEWAIVGSYSTFTFVYRAYRSTDHGQTWTEVGNYIPADSAPGVSSGIGGDMTVRGTDIFCAVKTFRAPGPSTGPSWFHAGIIKSTDLGATWTRVFHGADAVGAGSGSSISALWYDALRDRLCGVGGFTTTSNCIISNDGGATWLLQSIGWTPEFDPGAGSVTSSTTLGLVVSIEDNEEIEDASNQYTSLDGVTWTGRGPTPGEAFHPYYASLGGLAADGDVVVGVAYDTELGTVRSADGGATWALVGPVGQHTIARVGPGQFITGTVQSVPWRLSTDSGLTFSVGGTFVTPGDGLVAGIPISPYWRTRQFAALPGTETIVAAGDYYDGPTGNAVAALYQAVVLSLPPAGALSLVGYRPRMLIGCTDDLTDDDIVDFRWDSGDSQLVNKVIFEFDYDDDTGGYTKMVIYSHDESVQRHGPRPEIHIQSQGLHTDLGAAAFLEARAMEIFRRFGDAPSPVLQCTVFYRKHHWEAGDIICVTSNFIPNLLRGNRGLDEEQFELVDFRPQFADQGRVIATLLDVEALSDQPLTISSISPTAPQITLPVGAVSLVGLVPTLTL